MNEILFIALGLVAGGLVAWFWATARTRASFARQVADLEGRARAAEGLGDELRSQVQQKGNRDIRASFGSQGAQCRRLEKQQSGFP